MPQTRYLVPTLTVADRLTLLIAAGVRSRSVTSAGVTRAATSSAPIPDQGIVMTGDLVVWPVPLVGSDQSHVGDWGQTLDRVVAMRPSIVVPGHGPVLRETPYLRLMSRLFASVNEQTRAAVRRGETLQQARASVKLDELRRTFAGESRVRGFLFDTYVTDPAVASAYADATAATEEKH